MVKYLVESEWDGFEVYYHANSMKEICKKENSRMKGLDPNDYKYFILENGARFTVDKC